MPRGHNKAKSKNIDRISAELMLSLASQDLRKIIYQVCLSHHLGISDRRIQKQLPNETAHQGQVLMVCCPGQTLLGAFSVPTDTLFRKCCSSSNQIKNVPASWGPTGCWTASTSLSVISTLPPCLESSEMTVFNFPLGREHSLSTASTLSRRTKTGTNRGLCAQCGEEKEFMGKRICLLLNPKNEKTSPASDYDAKYATIGGWSSEWQYLLIAEP